MDKFKFDIPVNIKYHGETDSLGRCHFSLHWIATYHPGHPDGEYRLAKRGQHFFADPRKFGFPQLLKKGGFRCVKK